MPNCQECVSLYFLVINNPFSIFQKAKSSIESLIFLYILLITFCLCTVPFSLITRIPTSNSQQPTPIIKHNWPNFTIRSFQLQNGKWSVYPLIWLNNCIERHNISHLNRAYTSVYVCVCVRIHVLLHEFTGKLVCMFSFEMKKS